MSEHAHATACRATFNPATHRADVCRWMLGFGFMSSDAVTLEIALNNHIVYDVVAGALLGHDIYTWWQVRCWGMPPLKHKPPVVTATAPNTLTGCPHCRCTVVRCTPSCMHFTCFARNLAVASSRRRTGMERRHLAPLSSPAKHAPINLH